MLASRRQHERIKMKLRLCGSSLADVARELSVTRTTVTSVSQGYRRSRRIETAIAAKLGLPPERVWPDRYGTCLMERSLSAAVPASRRAAMP